MEEMRWRDQSGPTRLPRAGSAEAGPARAKRPRIGVLVDSLRKTYQTTVLAGISDAAHRRDVDVAVFAGGVLGAPRSDGINRNFIFDLANPGSIDGVIMLGGALGNFLGPASVADLCTRLAPLPIAAVAIAPPAVPSLLVDEEPGLRQALEHLIVRHGCRRLAFIRGPSVNAEAEHRYAIYRAVLEERGLGFDPDLVCEGTFEESAGEAAVALLVDERKVQFDALVASNDYMALGAIPALQERDLRVPSDVAVVGFDDIEDARFSTPPLTTVRQPLYQQGEAALDLVLAQLDGAEVAPQTTAATELVVRQSCGCLSGLVRPGRVGTVTPTSTPIESLLAEHGDDLARQIARAVHGADAALAPGWDRQIVDAFEAELRGAGAGLFASTLDRLLAGVGRRRRRRRRLASDGLRVAPAAAAGVAQRAPALGAGRRSVARGAHPDRRAGRTRAGAAPPAQRTPGQRADRERRDAARDPAGRRADRSGRAPAAAAGDPGRVDGALRSQRRSRSRRTPPPAWCCATTPNRCWPVARSTPPRRRSP